MLTKPFLTLVALSFVIASGASDAPKSPVKFKKIKLTDEFLCEGAYFGDFNKDGKTDLVAGWRWWQGPDFKQTHEYAPPPAQPYNAAKSYSDYFLTYVYDFNGDQWDDILVFTWPGREAAWYENPQKRGGHWFKHSILAEADNESPQLGDMNGDGKPELICHTEGRFGFAELDWRDPTRPAKFRAISPEDRKNIFRYTHGYGFGDMNGDGRPDLLEKNGWWEQPANVGQASRLPAGAAPAENLEGGAAETPAPLWKFHKLPFAPEGLRGGAQMLVQDVNGDGLNDVITSWDAHGYGLAWYEQARTGGQISFKEHLLVNTKPEDNKYGVKFTQIHALTLADINGDGLKDFVTGKRFWAHGPAKDAEPGAPAVLYWFELKRGPNKTAQFIPHRIDDDSGVGTQITTGDLNGDGRIDVISGNKKGLSVFIQQAP